MSARFWIVRVQKDGRWREIARVPKTVCPTPEDAVKKIRKVVPAWKAYPMEATET